MLCLGGGGGEVKSLKSSNVYNKFLLPFKCFRREFNLKYSMLCLRREANNLTVSMDMIMHGTLLLAYCHNIFIYFGNTYKL